MNMRITLILTLVIFQLLSGFATMAQNPKLEDWHEGHLTLTDNSILAGEINYNYAAQTISIKVDSLVQIYGPNQITEFSVVRKEVIHFFKSLNLGDGIKVYHVIGEGSKVAYLEYVFSKNLFTGYDQGYIDPVTGIPSTRNNQRRKKASKNLETSKDANVGASSYLIAVMATGKQFLFKSPELGDLSLKNREYLTNKKEIMRFLKTIDPSIEDYMKEKGLKFRRDQIEILQKTLNP